MILIHEIKKNTLETIGIWLSDYKDTPVCNVRVILKRDDGESIQTRKGLTFNVGLLPELIAALQKAQRQIED